MKQISALIFFVLLLGYSKAQSSAIAIDGKFDDWTSGLATYMDAPESIAGIDLLSFQVTNDEEYLYLHLIMDTEIILTDNLIDHGVRLYLDTDDDSSTGFTGAQAGFGAELGIVFRDRFAYYNVTPSSTLDFDQFDFRREVTTSGTEFEMAIKRDVIPDGINPLFTSNTIRVLFVETFDNDEMPNSGDSFSYTFDETPVSAYTPVLLEKSNIEDIRCLTYNTMNQIDDPGLQDEYERILQSLNPDIIGFSEVSGSTSAELKSQLDAWLPLGTVEGWYVIKDDFNLITASKWPITSNWTSQDRFFPSIIDLPTEYDTDIIFINTHLKCCGDASSNAQRQLQVDEFAEFILDAKTPGGLVTVADDTPFVFGGDMNLVGYVQQYQTILTGDIQNTGVYGSGAPLDWDDSDITDACPLQSEKRMAYTYRNDGNNYPPGRLDFMFYSDAVMDLPKSFVLRTEIMSTGRLTAYGLNSGDTEAASDHYPIVCDFSLIPVFDTDLDGISDDLDNCPFDPNPGQEDWNSNAIGDTCEDSDVDGLTDEEELSVFETDPSNADTDGDNLDDALEVNLFGTDPNKVDTDDDGLTDALEIGFGVTDPLLFDSDGDGCDDASFFHNQCPGQSTGEDPCPVDTNADGAINILDLISISSAFGTACP